MSSANTHIIWLMERLTLSAISMLLSQEINSNHDWRAEKKTGRRLQMIRWGKKQQTRRKHQYHKISGFQTRPVASDNVVTQTRYLSSLQYPKPWQNSYQQRRLGNHFDASSSSLNRELLHSQTVTSTTARSSIINEFILEGFYMRQKLIHQGFEVGSRIANNFLPRRAWRALAWLVCAKVYVYSEN